MANESAARSKWKKSLSTLRRQSTVSEPSASLARSASIMEEETTEAELDTYLSQLKNKSGLKNLWSGKNFEGIVERDDLSDVTFSGEIDRTKLKDLHLDSDEEDLKRFIQDLSSDEGTHMTGNSVVQEESNNDEEYNLMDNIQFAEVNIDYDGLDISGREETYEDDFLPHLFQPQFREIDSDSDADSLKHVSFKKENVILLNQSTTHNNETINHDVGREVDKSISIMNGSVTLVKNQLGNASQHDSDHEDIDEIPEEFDDSRARTPAKSNDFNYTESNFETLTEAEQHKATSHHRSRTAEPTESLSMTVPSDRDSSASKITHSSSSRNSSRKSKSKQNKSSGRKQVKSKRSSHSHNLSNSLSLNTNSDSMSEITACNLHYKNAHTQTEPKNVQLGWAISGPQLGRDYIDPTPIATHVVNSDSIEAITAFNPSIIALNDMLKYQLQLTRQFIDNSWRLHKAYSEGPSSNYRYTRLENTMEYIHKYAPKVISYEDALKEVTETS